MANKLGLYWSAPGRNFRRTRSEIESDAYNCPKCKTGMVKKIYKHLEDGGKGKVLVCPSSDCLFVLKFDNVCDEVKKEDPETPTEGSLPEPCEDEQVLQPIEVTAKAASLDLDALQKDLSAKFDVELLDDLLSLKNRIGHPKTIYINDSGEIWSDDADAGVQSAKSVSDAREKIRELTASSDQVFMASDLATVLAGCDCGSPALQEDAIQTLGNEIVPDVLNEPGVLDLGLPEDDQNEIAVMVFDTLLASKQEALDGFDLYLAPRLASHLNSQFENLTFTDLGDGSIHVGFDSKYASGSPSRAQVFEVLKAAAEQIQFSDYYKQLIETFSEKVSSELPDYFAVRGEVLAEVLEQINGQEA